MMSKSSDTIRILADAPVLTRLATEMTDDLNEAYYLVHRVLVRALAQGGAAREAMRRDLVEASSGCVHLRTARERWN